MSLNSPKIWLQVTALIISSPLFAAIFLLTVTLIASAIPFPHSIEQWLGDDMLVRAVSFSLFTAALSVDLMINAMYLTLPILVGGAIALLRLDMGFQSKYITAFISASCMGILYTVAYLVGTAAGWVEPAFYT